MVDAHRPGNSLQILTIAGSVALLVAAAHPALAGPQTPAVQAGPQRIALLVDTGDAVTSSMTQLRAVGGLLHSRSRRAVHAQVRRSRPASS